MKKEEVSGEGDVGTVIPRKRCKVLGIVLRHPRLVTPIIEGAVNIVYCNVFKGGG